MTSQTHREMFTPLGTALVKAAHTPVVLSSKKQNCHAQDFLPGLSIRKNAWQREVRSKGIFGEQGLHPPSPQLERLAFPTEQS